MTEKNKIELTLTLEQIKAAVDCLGTFSSERKFAEKTYPTDQEMADFGLYMKEVIKDSDIESIREALKIFRKLTQNE